MGFLDTFRRIFSAVEDAPAENSLTVEHHDEAYLVGASAGKNVVKYPAVVEELAKTFSKASNEELQGRLDDMLRNSSKLCKLDRLAAADALVTVLCGRGVRGIEDTLKKVAALSPSCGHHCSGADASAGFLAQLANKAGRILLENDMKSAGAYTPAKKADFLIRSLRQKAGACGTAEVEVELLSEIHEEARDTMLQLLAGRGENPLVREAALAVLEIDPDENVQSAVATALENEIINGDIAMTESLAGFLAKVGGNKSADKVKKMLATAGEDTHRQILIQTLGGYYEREVMDSGELRRLLEPYLTDPHPETASVAEEVLGLIDYEKFRRED